MTLKEIKEGSRAIVVKMNLPPELKTRLKNFSIREKSIVKVEVNSLNGVIVKVDEGYYVIGNAIAKKIEVRDD